MHHVFHCRTFRVLVAAVSGVIAMHSRMAGAQTWIGPAGSWSNPANWFNGQLPAPGGVAHFGSELTAAIAPSSGGFVRTIEVDQSVSLSRLDITNRAFSVDIHASNGLLTLVGKAEVYADSSTPHDGRLSYTLRGSYLSGVSGSAGLTKLGPGDLPMYANNFTGDVRIKQGRVIAASDDAFGAASNTVVLDGGTVGDLPLADYAGPASRNIQLTATGGAITPYRFFTWSGNITGAGRLTVGSFDSTGTLTISSSPSYTGPTRLAGARIALGGNGLIRQSQSFELDSGTLVLNNSSTINTNRLSDSAPIKIHSGHLLLQGNSSTAMTESVGTITVAGAADLVVTQELHRPTVALAAKALEREGRGTALLSRFSSHIPGSLIVDNAPQLIGGGGVGEFAKNSSVVPFASTYWGSNVVMYDPATHVLFEPYDSNYSTLAATAPDINVRQKTNFTLSSAKTVNSIVMSHATLSGSGTLSVTSGVVLYFEDATIAAPLNFPGGEGIIGGGAGGAGTLSSAISATNGVTFHDGSFTVSGTSSYTGVTTLNAASLVIGSVTAGVPGPLGVSPGAVEMTTGSNLYFKGGQFNRGIKTISGGLGTAIIGLSTASANETNISGNISIDGALNARGAAGTLTLSGQISGTGLVDSTANALNLVGANTHSGGLVVAGGTVRIGSGAAVGSGELLLGAGFVGALDVPVDVPNRVSMQSVANFASGPALTLSGPIEMGFANTLTLASSANVTFAGNVVAGNIAVQGQTPATSQGLLRLSGDNRAFGGTLTIARGATVELTSANALGSTLNGTYVRGGTIQFSGASISINGESLSLLTEQGQAATIRNIGGNNTWSAPIVFDGPTAHVVDGSLTLINPAGAIGDAAATLTKTGSSLLVLKKPVFHQINVQQGTVQLQQNGTIAGAGKIQNLWPSGAGALDLTNNDLILDVVLDAQPGTTVRDRLETGYDNGTWRGPGINSSAAADDPTHSTTLGMMSGAEYTSVTGDSTFAGYEVDPAASLIRYSYFGDANFDQTLDEADYSRIDIGFANVLGGWVNGDFDYDDIVNFADYALIDYAFNVQNGTLDDAIAYLESASGNFGGLDPAVQKVQIHFGQFGEPYKDRFLAQVPEPSTGIAATAALAATVLRRRRRLAE